MLRPVAALALVFALLAGNGAATVCADDGCADDGCADDGGGDRDCPPDCGQCICCPHLVVPPVVAVAALPLLPELTGHIITPPDALLASADPQEVFHVPKRAALSQPRS